MAQPDSFGAQKKINEYLFETGDEAPVGAVTPNEVKDEPIQSQILPEPEPSAKI